MVKQICSENITEFQYLIGERFSYPCNENDPLKNVSLQYKQKFRTNLIESI